MTEKPMTPLQMAFAVTWLPVLIVGLVLMISLYFLCIWPLLVVLGENTSWD